MSKYYRVSDENGEIVEGARVILPEQQQAIKKAQEKQAVMNRASKPFVFTEMGAITGGLSTLKNKELGYFLIMQTYVDYKNMLKKTPDANIPLSNKELAEILGVTVKTVNSILKGFEQKGFIKREKVESYGKMHKAIFISADYCFKKGVSGEFSKKKTDKAVKVFIDSLQDAYAQGLQPADIGFVYKTIQFIHYDTNLLVTNPSEPDKTQLKIISSEDLAELMGLSAEETSRKLSSLTWQGQYIFARIRVGVSNKVKIQANPQVLYRKAGEPSEDLAPYFLVPSN